MCEIAVLARPARTVGQERAQTSAGVEPRRGGPCVSGGVAACTDLGRRSDRDRHGGHGFCAPLFRSQLTDRTGMDKTLRKTDDRGSAGLSVGKPHFRMKCGADQSPQSVGDGGRTSKMSRTRSAGPPGPTSLSSVREARQRTKVRCFSPSNPAVFASAACATARST